MSDLDPLLAFALTALVIEITPGPNMTYLAALSLSTLTGPNEAGVMAERGVFGLSLWESLSADFRNRTVVDLAGAMAGGWFPDAVAESARAVLAGKPDEVRRDVADRLRAAGVTEQRLADIGL